LNNGRELLKVKPVEKRFVVKSLVDD